MGSRVSIVVVAYNSGAHIARCLRAVRADDASYEVVVVNNGDPCVEIEDAARFGGVTVVTPPANLGYAGGCNLGARVATGATFVFLNPDTVVAPGSLTRLVEALGDPSVGIAVARLRLLAQPHLLQSAGTVIHVSGLAWSGGFGEPADSVTMVTDVSAPCGAAMALRAETFAELGGFHDEFFLYQEDVQLGWRAQMLGHRIVVVPTADVYHDYDFERNARKRYFMERNRIAFLVTCFALRTLLVLAPLLIATELAMIVIAVRQRWMQEKVAGWTWLARNARGLLRRRRQTQRVRRLGDRDLAGFLSAVADPAMLPLPAFVRVLNPLVAAYWAVARRAL